MIHILLNKRERLFQSINVSGERGHHAGSIYIMISFLGSLGILFSITLGSNNLRDKQIISMSYESQHNNNVAHSVIAVGAVMATMMLKMM